MMKFECKDVAFLLICRFDSIDRLENALMVTDFLLGNFDTNVYFVEYASFDNGIFRKLMAKDLKYTFCKDDNPILHRTKHLNSMIRKVEEKYVSIWDVDVIAPVNQIVKSVEKLRTGTDFVYPYEKNFYDTSMEIRKHFYVNRDMDFLFKSIPFMANLYPPNPVGGAFFADRKAYIDSGLEKEQFYGWGVEDGERFARWTVQNRKVDRVEGPLFHFSHARGVNSRISSIESELVKQRIFNLSLRQEAWKNIKNC